MTNKFDNENYRNDGFTTMKRWLENRNEGKTLDKYFLNNKLNNIAIYGIGEIGSLLYEELRESKVNISYFIDRNAEGLNKIDSIPVITIDKIQSMSKVDIIVVTPIGRYESINKFLVKLAPEIRTISLQEIMYEF